MLTNRNILIGVTAGIAAYKIPLLVRLLVKEGAHVKVILTKDATQFVTPQTLSVLSKNEVITDFFDSDHNWHNHVKLAEWADLMLIAPATANTMAKMACGICDNVLLATYLSAKTKVMLAPAMDLDMYLHPAIKTNLHTLQSFGNIIIPAESGELASGLVGEGRMSEPETILLLINKYFETRLPLSGKKVLINAGPTYEAIDPVRFIGNRSSGKMGISLADAFVNMGAEVTLILGPSVYLPKNKTIKVNTVESANEMYEECMAKGPQSSIIVCAAAVSDYKAKNIQKNKIKKDKSELVLELEKTEDILAELGKKKTNEQCLVGFALETDNVMDYAKEKLVKKNLDIIIANNAKNQDGVVFGSDSNQVTIIDKNNNLTKFELLSKEEIAKKVVSYILNYIGVKK